MSKFWSPIGFSAHDFAYKVLCVVRAQARSIPHLAHVSMFFACPKLSVCSLTVHLRGVAGLMRFFLGCVCCGKRQFFDDRFLGTIFVAKG